MSGTVRLPGKVFTEYQYQTTYDKGQTMKDKSAITFTDANDVKHTVTMYKHVSNIGKATYWNRDDNPTLPTIKLEVIDPSKVTVVDEARFPTAIGSVITAHYHGHPFTLVRIRDNDGVPVWLNISNSRISDYWPEDIIKRSVSPIIVRYDAGV